MIHHECDGPTKDGGELLRAFRCLYDSRNLIRPNSARLQGMFPSSVEKVLGMHPTLPLHNRPN